MDDYKASSGEEAKNKSHYPFDRIYRQIAISHKSCENCRAPTITWTLTTSHLPQDKHIKHVCKHIAHKKAIRNCIAFFIEFGLKKFDNTFHF